MKDKINSDNDMSKASIEDKKQISLIWEECFGDPQEYIDLCLEANLDKFFVYKLDNKTVAMLCVIPCIYGSLRGGYVYAVATLPQYQGKGYSKKLLAYAEKQMKKEGFDFSALVPATNGLFNFYSSQGYETAFYCSKYSKTKNLDEKEPPEIDIQKIGVDEFIELKQALKKPSHVLWSTEHLEFLYKENEFVGGDMYKINANGEQGVAVVSVNENNVFVKDIIGCSQIEDFSKLMSLKYSKDCVLRAESLQGNKIPFGMAKSFKENIKIFDGYISLVLD